MTNLAEEAIEEILEGHWAKGAMRKTVGTKIHYCVVGGLETANVRGESNDNFWETLCKADNIACNLFPDRIDKREENLTRTVAIFNDHPETTFEDVKLVLKHLARELDQ